MKDGSTMVKSISGIECNLRKSDGYVNATELIKAHNAKTGENRKIAKWLETDRAKAYIEAVAKRCEKLPFDLIETRSGKGGLEQHLMMVFGFMFAAASAKEFERLMDAKFRGIYQLQLWGSK